MPTEDPTSSPGSSQSREVQIVPFDTNIFSDVIEVVTMPDGKDGAVVKKICDNLEVMFPAQLRKLLANPISGVLKMSIPDPRGILQETWVIPVTKIAWWLMTINAKKVKASLSPKLLKYQEALADVLDAYCRGKTREQVTASQPFVEKTLPVSIEEWLFQSAQVMLEHKRRLKEVEAKAEAIEETVHQAAATIDLASKKIVEVNDRVDEVEATAKKALGYVSGKAFTIVAWVKLQGVRVANIEKWAIGEGLRCRKISDALGFVPAERVLNGTVYMARRWPMEIIEIWWPNCCERHGWPVTWVKD